MQDVRYKIQDAGYKMKDVRYRKREVCNMRRRVEWNDGWYFTGQDGRKQPCSLPHTWNALDGQDGGNDYYRGTGIYEKSFNAPSFDSETEDIYLEFAGVNASSKVFLNDRLLSTHDGGYSLFRVKLTEQLSPVNRLRVEVDNSVNDRVYPQKADFTFYGGIYREVTMLMVNRRHFALETNGTPGIRVTSRVTGENGLVDVEVCIPDEHAQVQIQLIDAENTVAAEGIFDVSSAHVPENDTDVTRTFFGPGHILQCRLTIPGVHLWNGVADPYLYTAVATLFARGQEAERIHHTDQADQIDQIQTRFGVRTFRVNPERGFILNGKSYPLHGVSRHQDYKGIGNAISREQHSADMEIIRELGANTIRLAHYQHDQFFYDLCDEYGMIVWAEIPYISEHMQGGRENSVSQMRELIVQNYNHPSIVTWGISNEITISTKDKKDMLDNHHLLNDLCHTLDDTRVTSLACYACCNPFGKIVHLTDIVSYNLYLGWYVPGLWLNDLFLSLFHRIYPGRCIGYSEYGAEGMPNLHSEHPHRGDHSEEYQAIYHEYMIKCFAKRPYMWSTHVWNMFDFAADARDQGGEPGMNHKGLVTFDRKIRKDSFYLYQAHWSSRPMVHICSKRFEERGSRIITVKVYSNQTEVALYQNDRLVERKHGDKIFCFQVELEPENHLEAVAGDAKDTARFVHVDNPKSYKLEKKRSTSANWV